MVLSEQYCEKHNEHFFVWCPKCPQPIATTTSDITTARGEEGRSEIIIREPTETEKFLEKQLFAAYAEIEALKKERDDYRQAMSEGVYELHCMNYAASWEALNESLDKYPKNK